MKIDILTLFPEICRAPLSESMMKRAKENKIVDLSIHNLRDWTIDKHHIVSHLKKIDNLRASRPLAGKRQFLPVVAGRHLAHKGVQQRGLADVAAPQERDFARCRLGGKLIGPRCA